MSDWHRFRFNAMGCPCELIIEGTTARKAGQALKLISAEVDRLERKYSTWMDDSPWQRVLKQAQQRAVEVDEETARLLDLAETGHRLSDGLFDISAGPLVRLWDFRKAVMPSPEAIESTRLICGWQRVSWDGQQLHLQLPEMHLDLDGIVKEYAADACATLLTSHGYQRALVNLGGDVACVNHDPEASPFPVAIENPMRHGEALASLKLTQGGLASSGCYQRCFEFDGQRYAHLIHPKTGWPVKGLTAVSVTAPQCTTAGFLATTALLMGHSGNDWLSETGLPWISVDDEGRLAGHIGPQSD